MVKIKTDEVKISCVSVPGLGQEVYGIFWFNNLRISQTQKKEEHRHRSEAEVTVMAGLCASSGIRLYQKTAPAEVQEK